MQIRKEAKKKKKHNVLELHKSRTSVRDFVDIRVLNERKTEEVLTICIISFDVVQNLK